MFGSFASVNRGFSRFYNLFFNYAAGSGKNIWFFVDGVHLR